MNRALHAHPTERMLAPNAFYVERNRNLCGGINLPTVCSPHLNHHQPRTVIQRRRHQNRCSGICLAKNGVYRPTVYKPQDSPQTILSVTMEINVDKILCRDSSHMKTKGRQSYVIPRTTPIKTLQRRDCPRTNRKLLLKVLHTLRRLAVVS